MVAGLHFQSLKRKEKDKHEECLISLTHMSISVPLLVVLNHHERYLNMQLFSQKRHIQAAATLCRNKHIHPECIAVVLSQRPPHGDAPCV